MVNNNNNGCVTVSSCFTPTTQSQYTLNTSTVTSSTWSTTATYNGFTGYCISEPVGTKYYRITPNARVKVSHLDKKVIWISEQIQ